MRTNTWSIDEFNLSNLSSWNMIIFSHKFSHDFILVGHHFGWNETYRFSHSIFVGGMNSVNSMGYIIAYGMRMFERKPWYCRLCVGANNKSEYFLVLSASNEKYSTNLTGPISTELSWMMRQMHRHSLQIILLIDFVLMTHTARKGADDRISKWKRSHIQLLV